ncbi:hypothetical protein GCM10007905_04280 [Mixta theicola]|nr:hypothetical protein GCM10007905_04280 [Mixta theicola]
MIARNEKNIMSGQPETEAAPGAFRLNQRILSIVAFNFASYLTIGLPLAVLPGYVHDVMGYSAFWAGLVISLQYLSTLLSRPHAGRYADLWGPKKVVIFGLFGCLLSGICYALAALSAGWPLISLAFMDLSLGITGPVAGFIMSYAEVSVIYLLSGLLVCLALLLTWRMRQRPDVAP